MAWHFITSLLSMCSNLLPSIRASSEAPSSSSSGNNTSEKERKAIEEDLEGLARTLGRINVTLQDSEEMDIESCSVKHWLKELKQVAYDAEDLLGEYKYEARRVQEEARKASEASGSNKRKQMDCIVPIPNDMAERLKKIRSRFDEIAKDREVLQLRESDGAKHPTNTIIQPPTAHMVDEANIFGRDAEVTKVIDFLLLEKEKPLSVISIIGKGGLGKTTIAQLVYKDRRVCDAFDLCGWVCVSEEFDVRTLIKATIESLCKQNCSVSELSPLQEGLTKTIKDKKILLVLDDVWNENESLWESFLIPFLEARLVRFLVTTRNNKVTKVMRTTVCFQLNYLPENSCWQIFQLYAFESTNNSQFVEMGREITRKCGGLPLAVKSIASLLRYKVDEENWREILESDLWESNSLNDIFPALKISYIHLPSHLKPCFLICSMYPKDYEFKKMNLIELWISHGYIKSSNKKGVREIGVEYYEELIGRSFLDQVFGFSKLHDIIHDLARLNSGGEHYSVDFARLNSGGEPNIQHVNIPQEIRHLYINGFTEYVNQILQQNLKGLRSLSMDIRICNGDSEHQYWLNNILGIDLNTKLEKHYKDCMRSTIIYNLNKFPSLRVLELSGFFLREIPDSITQLTHLSFLHICSGHLEKLPSSMNLLYNLQTLILDCEASPLEHLPESIGNLINLKFLYINVDNLHEFPKSLCSLSNLEALHLYMIDAPSELPSALGNCCKLKTLKSNNIFYYNPHDLRNFPVIRTMDMFLEVGTIGWLKDMKDVEGEIIIEGLENMSNLVDARYANIKSKGKIKTLQLNWDCNYLDLSGWKWDKQLIISLQEEQPREERVTGEDMDYDILEYLQPHPRLEKLVLECYPSATIPSWMGDPLFLQAIQEIELESCSGLQSLPFSNLHTLKRFRVSCHGFRVMRLKQLPTQLEELEISYCHNLELIAGLRGLKMLAELDIDSCEALKSITMDDLQPAESTDPCGSFHEKPQDGHLNNTSSLKKLHIGDCPLLCALPRGLVPSGSCKVWIYGRCGLLPDLQIGGTSGELISEARKLGIGIGLGHWTVDSESDDSELDDSESDDSSRIGQLVS